ncbi:MAG: TlpA family protein disulfide reductase [Candidatus Eremiobacteraeota bacterium]|nr:TlpA family protein disulfide reductase [Candidatus Eremiobacteraeota bacterium]
MENARRPWLRWGRLLDLIAIAIIAYVGWKIFIAPRSLTRDASAYPAPHVAYERLRGGVFHIEDARGRVLFLDFFASWCEPCRLEMPLVEAYARKHPEIEVVAVDVGEPRVVAAAFAKRYHITNVALDPTTSAQGFFQIQGFPTIVVIDPKGRIRANWSGFNPAIQMAMANAERSL